MATAEDPVQALLFFGVNEGTACFNCGQLRACVRRMLDSPSGSNDALDGASDSNALTRDCPGKTTLAAIGGAATGECMSPAAGQIAKP